MSGVHEAGMWETVAAPSLEVWSCCWFGLLWFSVLFGLPKSQSADCFKQLFNSFSDGHWIAKETRGLFKDCYMEYIDNQRYVYIDEAGNGPQLDDMTAFVSRLSN